MDATQDVEGGLLVPTVQRVPTFKGPHAIHRSSMSGTCTTWQGSTCTALKVHKFLRLLGPEDTRTAVGSLPSGAHIQVCLLSIHHYPTACTHHWEQPNSSLQEVHSEEWLKKQLCYLSDCRRHRSGLQRMGIAAPDHPPATPVPCFPHQVDTGCVRFHLGGGGMKFLAFSYLLLQFTMILAQNYIYMHDVAKLKLANSKSQSYIGCHSLTDRCDFTTEKMVGGTLPPLLSFAPPPLVSSHGPERKQSYFPCKLTVKCKLEKATNRCSPPSGSAKGGVSICYMSVFMNIWYFTWRLAGDIFPMISPMARA